MWTKLKYLLHWLWTGTVRCHVRLSGTFTPYRHYCLPVRFQILMQLHSSTGRAVYLCDPIPDPSGQLIWYAPTAVNVCGEDYELVRLPSAVPPPEPVYIQGSAYVPEEWQEHLRFTLKKP